MDEAQMLRLGIPLVRLMTEGRVMERAEHGAQLMANALNEPVTAYHWTNESWAADGPVSVIELERAKVERSLAKGIGLVTALPVGWHER